MHQTLIDDSTSTSDIIYTTNRIRETHIMQYTSFTSVSKERVIVSNENRMKESFRTIIYRLREVSPGGVEMILEDTETSLEEGNNSTSRSNSKEVHPLTHPLVFHYAVWSKDIKKVQYALKFLSNHCKHWKSNTSTNKSSSFDCNDIYGDNDLYSIANVCTYQIIVKAMKMKTQYPTIQASACKVIEDSLFITSNEKRTAAYDSGALKAVIDAMNTFPDKTVVQRNGCGALLFLVWDSYSIAKKLIIDHNGHVTIINALRTFPNDITIQRNACWLLCNISEMKGLESYLLNNDALSVLGLAFQGYNTHGSVLIRSSASQAMSKLLHYENTHPPDDGGNFRIRAK
jgi:hypothetical protein